MGKKTEIELGAGVKRASVSAILTRANGTREDLGVIADSDRDRVKPSRGFLGRMKDMF